ncbi:uncharacterized protein F4807DRAFT_462250 [Annulohypoxylon truncatum]|uniref:uncharacterized protein n=1 Tax=Annulohypoxylon truncatum TaxID=327061 RepID=UPI002007480E|nr:uncharacterized protein F4807DRAFT_462250 [Annulohypoxylon truncatum]KAI1207806.1 hypothetical protein F4807DRAFT_462250 [Annulohypoxylon truncatum]
MPYDACSSGQKANFCRRHDKSGSDNDSTKTRRGSPVPQPPDVSGHNDSSAGTHKDKDNMDLDLLGFGAQFDDKK